MEPVKLFQYRILEAWAKLITDNEVMELMCQKAKEKGMPQGEIEYLVEYFNCCAQVIESSPLQCVVGITDDDVDWDANIIRGKR